MIWFDDIGKLRYELGEDGFVKEYEGLKGKEGYEVWVKRDPTFPDSVWRSEWGFIVPWSGGSFSLTRVNGLSREQYMGLNSGREYVWVGE